jgi:hypothetical protein
MELMRLVTAREEELLQKLDGQIKDTFLEFTKMNCQANEIEHRESFINGFRIGMRFLLESIAEYDGSFEEIAE